MADLSSLPPPPKGQTGVTLQSLSSLPPPPQGQVGIDPTHFSPAVSRILAMRPSYADASRTAVQTAGNNLGQDFANRGQQITDTAGRSIDALSAPTNHSLGDLAHRTGAVLSSVLQTGGAVAQGAGDIANRSLQAVNDIAKSQVPGVQAAEDFLAQGVQNDPRLAAVAGAAASIWGKLSPEEQRNIGSAASIASLLLANKGSPDIHNPIPAISQMPGDVASAVQGGFNLGNKIADKVKPAVDWVKQNVTNRLPVAVNRDAINQTITSALKSGNQIQENLPGTATPDLVKNIQNDMTLQLRHYGQEDAAKAIEKLNPNDYSSFDEFSNDAKKVITNTPISKEQQAIQDIITPKLDAKAVKLALSEGRITPGQTPGLLQDGTPDQVLPSTQTTRATQTIADNIPNAHKMKAPELYTALDKKITSIATQLKPEMEAVPITSDVVDKITTDWEALKPKQLANPYYPATANVEKLQANFENFLQTSKSGNMNDLWDTAKAYDASVPASVKNATSLSSDALQTQKSLWLQNRGILKSAINDASLGLGDTSQNAFSKMSDMYNAQKGIQSSFKVATEGEASVLKTWIKNNKIKSAIIGGAVLAPTGLPKKGLDIVTGGLL